MGSAPPMENDASAKSGSSEETKTETAANNKQLTDDGGVVKAIVKEGEGDCPKAGCMVSVHYTGTLASDSTEFDSSRTRPGPFRFKVGAGRVIKGWDICILTMKKGERCTLTCAPDYAYGTSGAPPKIPPNAVLKFDVELLDFALDDTPTASPPRPQFVSQAVSMLKTHIGHDGTFDP